MSSLHQFPEPSQREPVGASADPHVTDGGTEHVGLDWLTREAESPLEASRIRFAYYMGRLDGVLAAMRATK